MCVSPRAGTQLDYFIFPMMVGRLLSSALATLMPSIGADQVIVVVLLVNGPLIVLFTLLVKSLRKAARLKEIMEYSSSPVLEAIGEYVSLVERNADSDSAEEDDSHDIAG
ncbi:unnamed protein product [Cylicostephanus goldi]|uniref:Uncharacterized protein n=1 Tax=Cylicostephanus goldi TaxID=71465 RepID=A0A3P6T0E3_CYLGO|nr:unnamed protein product [Cylicostephanus goldi]